MSYTSNSEDLTKLIRKVNDSWLECSSAPLSISGKGQLNKYHQKKHTSPKNYPTRLATDDPKSSNVNAPEYGQAGRKETIVYNNPANYVPPLNKTPLNLTPSQRLMLRKSQLNEGISQIGKSAYTRSQNPLEGVDNNDEIVDAEHLYNVPVSLGLANYDNASYGDACTSLNPGSARSLSVSSKESSVTSVNENLDIKRDQKLGTISKQAVGYEDQLQVSPLDLALALLNSEKAQIIAQSREKKELMMDFKKLNLSLHLEASVDLRGTGSLTDSRHISMMISPSNKKTKKYHSVPPECFSSTRPSWLPPKMLREKRDHESELSKMIDRAIMKESAETLGKIKRIENLEKLKENDKEYWEKLIFNKSSNSLHFHDMVYRGIPSTLKDLVWYEKVKLISDVTESRCELFLENVENLLVHRLVEYCIVVKKMSKDVVKKKFNLYSPNVSLIDPLYSNKGSAEFIRRNPDLPGLYIQFEKIENDLNVCRYCSGINDTNMMFKLKTIILSFNVYLNQLEKNDLDNISVNLDKYISQINPLAVLLYFHFKNSSLALLGMIALMSLEIPNLCLKYVVGTTDEKQVCSNLLKKDLLWEFETLFERNIRELHMHFNFIGISSLDYVPIVIVSLFTCILNFETSADVLGIFLFEGSSSLIKILLRYLKSTSHKLFGSKQEVLDILTGRVHNFSKDTSPYLDIGSTIIFLDDIKKELGNNYT